MIFLGPLLLILYFYRPHTRKDNPQLALKSPSDKHLHETIWKPKKHLGLEFVTELKKCIIQEKMIKKKIEQLVKKEQVYRKLLHELTTEDLKAKIQPQTNSMFMREEIMQIVMKEMAKSVKGEGEPASKCGQSSEKLLLSVNLDHAKKDRPIEALKASLFKLYLQNLGSNATDLCGEDVEAIKNDLFELYRMLVVGDEDAAGRNCLKDRENDKIT